MSNQPALRRTLHFGLLAVGTACLAAGQQLTQVRIDSAAPALLFDELERAGFDVLLDQRHVDVIVSPEELAHLRARGFDPATVAKGQPLRDILAAANAGRGVPSGYQDLGEIQARMAQTALDHPAICEVVDLTVAFGAPLTVQGRSLLAMKISDNVGLDEDEPAVLVASAHHCREIVTPVVALEAIDRLTDDYGVVSEVTQAVDTQEIWIIPVCNPDGYEYVFNVDNLWRKNRRPVPGGIGVDLNRNYPQGWENGCSGSTNGSSQTYKGASAGSEAEVQAIIALAESRRFAKVIDFHSSGREVLWGYACPTHPFDAYYRAESTAISVASGYGGAERRPSADGEHQQWHHGRRGAWAVLIEVATQFQPSFAAAQAEAAQVWGGVDWLLARAIPLSGHVTDACSGAPLDATITLVGVSLPAGEENRSGGAFGRWHANLPPGTHTLRFDAPGYDPLQTQVSVAAGGAATLDVQLVGTTSEIYCAGTQNSTGQVADVGILGSTSVASNSLQLFGSGLPPQQFCLFVYGQTETQVPLFDGFLCFSDPIVRLDVAVSDFFGQVSLPVDLANPPQSVGQITPGTTWNFQIFYRDPGFGTSGANLTRGLRVPFCP